MFFAKSYNSRLSSGKQIRRITLRAERSDGILREMEKARSEIRSEYRRIPKPREYHAYKRRLPSRSDRPKGIAEFVRPEMRIHVFAVRSKTERRAFKQSIRLLYSDYTERVNYRHKRKIQAYKPSAAQSESNVFNGSHTVSMSRLLFQYSTKRFFCQRNLLNTVNCRV